MNEATRTIASGLRKPRSGWIIRGIGEKAETVLQHTKKVVRAAKIYGKHIVGLDYEKFVKMALYHDFAEHKEKDYLPGEITRAEKYLRERAVMETIRDSYNLPCGQEVYDLWIEFEARETEEAKILFQLDRLDGAIQALEYEKEGHSSVTDFYPDTLQKISDPTLKNIFEILLRKEFSHVSFYEQYFVLLELSGDEGMFYQQMHRGILEEMRKDFMDTRIQEVIELGDQNSIIGLAMVKIDMSGGEITEDTLRGTLGVNYPSSFTLETIDNIAEEVEYYQLNFENSFWEEHIRKRASEILETAKNTGYITTAEAMILRFNFSGELALPISQISEENIAWHQSGALQFGVSKQQIGDWILAGKNQEG